MQKTPKSFRLQILLLGRCNVGKSTLINALTRREVAIVSEQAGTTTDPVEKTMEFPGLGPVVLIDTAGFDDRDTPLGQARLRRTLESLDRADLVLWVGDGQWNELDDDMVRSLHKRQKRTLYVLNKTDAIGQSEAIEQQVKMIENAGLPVIRISALKKINIDALQKLIASKLEARIHTHLNPQCIVSDLIPPKGHVIFVVPIDAGAPRGRLILPQVQAIRDILDQHQTCTICQTQELTHTLSLLKSPPDLVVTDSQAFAEVERQLPISQSLTSFSILLARLKADFYTMRTGAIKIDNLPSNAKILIAEACTHKPSEEDIGTFKIPTLLRQRYPDVQIDFTAGNALPALKSYDLIVHCGACVWNGAQMKARLIEAQLAGVAITNYGMAIAACLGILERATQPLMKEKGN